MKWKIKRHCYWSFPNTCLLASINGKRWMINVCTSMSILYYYIKYNIIIINDKLKLKPTYRSYFLDVTISCTPNNLWEHFLIITSNIKLLQIVWLFKLSQTLKSSHKIVKIQFIDWCKMTRLKVCLLYYAV